MANDYGKIKNNLNIHLNHLQDIVRDNFNMSKREQKKFIDDATKDSMGTTRELAGATLTSFTDIYFFVVISELFYKIHVQII
jgi:hypothetical protein